MSFFRCWKKPTTGEWKVIGCFLILIVLVSLVLGGGLIIYLWVKGVEIPAGPRRALLILGIILAGIIAVLAAARKYLE